MEEMVRSGRTVWDNCHLSPGPIIQQPNRDPVMFYMARRTMLAGGSLGTFDQHCTASRIAEWSIIGSAAGDGTGSDRYRIAASAVIQDDGDPSLFAGGRLLSRAVVEL